MAVINTMYMSLPIIINYWPQAIVGLLPFTTIAYLLATPL